MAAWNEDDYHGVQVKIGDVTLGEFGTESNPQTITYRIRYNIAEMECIPKRKTQAVQVNGLWEITMQFKTVKKDTHVALKNMLDDGAGPYYVVTDLMNLSMYIKDAQVTQEPGSANTYEWNIQLIESND
jgi:hypothetical protein